jgi:hypothetical protein
MLVAVVMDYVTCGPLPHTHSEESHVTASCICHQVRLRELHGGQMDITCLSICRKFRHLLCGGDLDEVRHLFFATREQRIVGHNLMRKRWNVVKKHVRSVCLAVTVDKTDRARNAALHFKDSSSLRIFDMQIIIIWPCVCVENVNARCTRSCTYMCKNTNSARMYLGWE